MTISPRGAPEFGRAVRGYDRYQVDSYLGHVHEYARELEARTRAAEDALTRTQEELSELSRDGFTVDPKVFRDRVAKIARDAEPLPVDVDASGNGSRGRTDEFETIQRLARPVLWSPAQLVSLVIGVAMLVLGIVAMIRTGFGTSRLHEPVEQVWNLGHTPLMAAIELAVAVVLVFAALRPVAGRAVMAVLSTAMLAFGVAVLADLWPRRLHEWFGVGHDNGWLFVALGGIGLVAAVVSPTFVRGGPTVVRRQTTTHSPSHVRIVDA
jgi:predicted anti-sigma-YlaC factor YlaD